MAHSPALGGIRYRTGAVAHIGVNGEPNQIRRCC